MKIRSKWDVVAALSVAGLIAAWGIAAQLERRNAAAANPIDWTSPEVIATADEMRWICQMVENSDGRFKRCGWVPVWWVR